MKKLNWLWKLDWTRRVSLAEWKKCSRKRSTISQKWPKRNENKKFAFWMHAKHTKSVSDSDLNASFVPFILTFLYRYRYSGQIETYPIL